MMMAIDETTRTELEAAAFRRLVAHLRERTDVQNIELMNLAGFCRNCLSNWLKDAADEKGPWFLGKTFSVIDLYFAFMTYWRPGRSWYEANAPRLFAIAQKAAQKPKIGKLIEGHMG
jgi:hypothetical protein